MDEIKQKNQQHYLQTNIHLVCMLMYEIRQKKFINRTVYKIITDMILLAALYANKHPFDFYAYI